MRYRISTIAWSILIVLTLVILVSANVVVEKKDKGDITIFYSGNLTSFLSLHDTPTTYDGQTGNCTKVNSTESGLFFEECLPSNINLTIENLTVTNILNVSGNIYADCIENFYEIEFTDNAAPANNGYLTLEGGINLGANYGRKIPMNATLKSWWLQSQTIPSCSTVPEFELKVNDFTISTLTLNGARSNSSSIASIFVEQFEDEMQIYSNSYSCTSAPDDMIIVVLAKGECS